MRLVESWTLRMIRKGCRFAMIKTTRARFDRVAIVADMQSFFTVQFPKGNERQGYVIHSEDIPKKEIVSGRYYQD